MTSPVRAPRPTPRRTEVAPLRDRRPDLRVVPPPVRARRTGAVVAVATVVVFASLLASALFHSVLVSGQLHLDAVDRQVQEEREDLRRDQLALAEAQSPERIAAEAAALGMTRPGQGETTWLGPEGGSPIATGGTTADDGAADDDGTSTDPGTDERADADGTTTGSEGAA